MRYDLSLSTFVWVHLLGAKQGVSSIIRTILKKYEMLEKLKNTFFFWLKVLLLFFCIRYFVNQLPFLHFEFPFFFFNMGYTRETGPFFGYEFSLIISQKDISRTSPSFIWVPSEEDVRKIINGYFLLKFFREFKIKIYFFLPKGFFFIFPNDVFQEPVVGFFAMNSSSKKVRTLLANL